MGSESRSRSRSRDYSSPLQISNQNDVLSSDSNFDNYKQRNQRNNSHKRRQNYNYKNKQYNNNNNELKKIQMKRKFDREMDDYFSRRQKIVIERDLQEQKLEELTVYSFNNDMINWQGVQIEIQIQNSQQKLIGEEEQIFNKLSELKSKITPIYKLWEQEIKFYISDYELIDVFRTKNNKYNSLINYNSKQFNMTQKIKSRDYFKLQEILMKFELVNNDKVSQKICSISDLNISGIHCFMDIRNKRMVKENSVRQNYIKDEYKIIVEQNIQSGMNANQLCEQLKLKGYKVQVQQLDYNRVDKDKGEDKFDIVIANGGLMLKTDDQYNYQELYNLKLYLSQIIINFNKQLVGGSFIIKISDSFHVVTKNLIKLLAKYYHQIHIVKPLTVRPACSEKFIVCQSFLGISHQEFQDILNLQQLWIKNENVNEYFQNHNFVTQFLNFPANHYDSFDQFLFQSNIQFGQIQIDQLQKGHDFYEKYYKIDKNEIEKQEQLSIQEKNSLQKAYNFCKAYQIPYLDEFVL